MWRTLADFPEYIIDDTMKIMRTTTGEEIKAVDGIVSLKDRNGGWKNRSVAKLRMDAFNTRPYIVATPVAKDMPEQRFYSIKEAADWLILTKQAITAGKLAAYQTVRTNIKKGIAQPELYPFIYGYSWEYFKEE